MGLGGGAAGRGVGRVMLCCARGPRGAAGAAGVCAPTLVAWQAGVCARGWAWDDVPQAHSFSLRLLEGFRQAFEDIRVGLGCGDVVGVDSLGMERIGQHGFPCGLWPPRCLRLEAAVLGRPPAVRVDQALEGGLCPGPLSQLPELRVGPALPPLSRCGALAFGGGVGVGVCRGVMGTGGGGRPGGLLLGLCLGGARGAGARVYADPWVRAHGLCFGVWLGSAGAVVAGHLLNVRRHRGLVRGRGRSWLALALLRSGLGWSLGLGCGLLVVAGRGASRLGRGALHHEGGGGGVGDVGGAP